MKFVKRLKKMERDTNEAVEWELIQLAAFIETDGSITTSGGIYPHISFTGRSDLPRLIWEKWGGCLSKYDDEGLGYQGEINMRKHVKAFLSALEPYLTIKQAQARVALKMIELLDTEPRDKQALRRLKAELSRLNHTPAPDIDMNELKKDLDKEEEKKEKKKGEG